MSASVMPDVLRKFWKSFSLGNDCFLVWLNCFSTSWSETDTPWSLASPWIHSDEIRNCMTWSRRPLYSWTHWALNWASVGLGWPFAGFGADARFSATQRVKFGASGTWADPLGWSGSFEPADEIAATFIQWLNSSVEMESPPTFATALPGIELPPQAAMVAAKATKKAPGARNRNRMRITARQGSA